MKHTDEVITKVIDAGGRYGLHPTWKGFSGELNYYLFEPDKTEADRLAFKYSHRKNEIRVLNEALSIDNGEITINFYKNLALSSSCIRNPVVSFYENDKRNEIEIVRKAEVKCTTIDTFCRDNNFAVDFLKLDTEGSEYQILLGGKQQISNSLLGIRCEVAFDYIFKDMATFSDINKMLLDSGFFLLNIDYSGRGDFCNEFAISSGRYGILTNSDAVWLRRREHLFDKKIVSSVAGIIRILKYAAFCLGNNASDLAIEVLIKARREFRLSFLDYSRTRLFMLLDKLVHDLFYKLKWQPGQSITKHKEVYKLIFEKEMLSLNEYNESTMMNPD
jgi:FkbM family methyltransferase